MIQKGIIEEIVNEYEVKVRIPRYDKTDFDGVKTEDLSTGIICTYPGTQVYYVVGDIVLVGFENDELSKPIILGLLYRETKTESSFYLPQVDESLKQLEQSINEINSTNTYTHIKYSNDNGKTFTSLYDYSDLEVKIDTDLNTYYFSPEITIDSNSELITWSIINNDNFDITSQFHIETTITVYKDEQSYSYTTTDIVIKIPLFYRNKDKTTISFKILKTIDISTYYVSLVTDINSIGTSYGDYIGTLVSSNQYPSSTPSDYTWSSSIIRSEKIVDSVSNELLPRIEANEMALYGYNKTTNDVTNTLGLLDAITVSNDSISVGYSKNNIYFDNINSVYIDNTDKSVNTLKINLGNFVLEKRTDNHLSLYVSEE